MTFKAIIVLADLHTGSYAGLCPKRAVLESGGSYSPNIFQKTTLKYFYHFKDEFVPRLVDKAEDVCTVVNGDPIEGDHHGTKAIFSNNCDVQAENAVTLLKLFKPFGKMFIVRGSEPHSGVGWDADEKIAQDLGCEPYADTGDFSTWQLWLKVYDHSLQFAHNIGTTSSAAYESSAPMRELISGLVDAAQWDRDLPDTLVRSHRHRFIVVPIPGVNGRRQCVITPGWQLRTPFSERIDRMRMPHIGGVVLLIDKDTNECLVKEKIYPLPQPKPIIL